VTDTVIEADPRAKTPGKPGRRRPVTVNVHGGTRVQRPVGYRRAVADVCNSISVHDRRAAAYKLRSGGFTLVDIGLYLHADPELNTNPETPDGLIGGYGWQNLRNEKPPLRAENLAKAVHLDMKRGLEVADRYESLAREEFRMIETATLNSVQAGLWAKVQRGDARAAEVVVKVSERRSKLLGLDAPVQTETKMEVSGHIEGVQPVYNREFAQVMFSALKELGSIDEIPVLDVEGVEVPLEEHETAPTGD